jgi:alkylmercury lyase
MHTNRSRLGMTTGDSEALIRAAAFRLLLAHARPIEPDELATATDSRTDRVQALLAELDRAGRIRRDGAGRVVGAAGLSVIPDRHQIQIDGRRFWTWCAYDILGIFAALAANGRAVSPSPDGSMVVVVFERGRPQKHSAVLFRPDDDLLACCENVYEEWCPNSNLFLGRRQAITWADERGIPGRVMGLDEASELGARDWADVVQRQG